MMLVVIMFYKISSTVIDVFTVFWTLVKTDA